MEIENILSKQTPAKVYGTWPSGTFVADRSKAVLPYPLIKCVFISVSILCFDID